MRHIAEAYTLKFVNRDQYGDIRHKGMAEMPSDLAMQVGLILFVNETTFLYIKHVEFQRHRDQYGSSPGYVYCDAGNGIMARIIDDRTPAHHKANPRLENLSSDKSKADLVEVVLYWYRNNLKSNARDGLEYLERCIERELCAVHDDQASDASGSACV